MEVDSIAQHGSEATLRLTSDNEAEGGFFSDYGVEQTVGRFVLINGIPIEDANRIYNFFKGIGDEFKNILPRYVELSNDVPGLYLMKRGAHARIVKDDSASAEASANLEKFYEYELRN